MKAKLFNGIKNGDNDPLENGRLPHVTYNGKLSSDARSMVANVPDNKCIWFDKSGTAIRNRSRIMTYLDLINRTGGVYGRILTEVVSRDRMQRGLYTTKVKILPYTPT